MNTQTQQNPATKVVDLKTPQKAVRKVIPFPVKTTNHQHNTQPTPPAAA